MRWSRPAGDSNRTSAANTEQHLLALVVLLKCYQRLGYFLKLADVPAVVVDYVRGKLKLDETVEAAHESDRTLWRHRDFVRMRMGVTYTPATVRAVAEAAIRKAAQSKDNPADLINVALDELVRQRCELPGYTTLDAMAAAIRTEVNGDTLTAVAARPDRLQLGDVQRRRGRSSVDGARHDRRSHARSDYSSAGAA